MVIVLTIPFILTGAKKQWYESNKYGKVNEIFPILLNDQFIMGHLVHLTGMAKHAKSNSSALALVLHQ